MLHDNQKKRSDFFAFVFGINQNYVCDVSTDHYHKKGKCINHGPSSYIYRSLMVSRSKFIS